MDSRNGTMKDEVKPQGVRHPGPSPNLSVGHPRDGESGLISVVPASVKCFVLGWLQSDAELSDLRA